MKRTTVKVSDEVDMLLRHEAARRGVTISEVTREILETHFGLHGEPRRRFLAAGAGRSGHTDTAARIEEILDEAWGLQRHS